MILILFLALIGLSVSIGVKECRKKTPEDNAEPEEELNLPKQVYTEQPTNKQAVCSIKGGYCAFEGKNQACLLQSDCPNKKLV